MFVRTSTAAARYVSLAATTSSRRAYVTSSATIPAIVTQQQQRRESFYNSSIGLCAVIATAVAGVVSTLTTDTTTKGRWMTQCETIPVYGVPGTNQERTFLAIKPDGVQRGLIGDIIARFEKRGYKLVGLKMVWPTEEMAAEHYADLSKKPFFPSLIKFFSSGPIVCMCWEGKDIIKQGRRMLGETQPLSSPPGSIRGDYSIDLGRNICHGSDSAEGAQHELLMWFPEGVNDWGKTVDSWVYE